MLLVLLASAPVLGAQGAPPSLSWITPEEGATHERGVPLWLRYEGASAGAIRVAGYVLLDGARIATFMQPLDTSGAALVRVPFDGNATALGAHVLEAVAWTEVDPAVETGPRAFTLAPYNARPRLDLAPAHYNLSRGAFVVTGTWGDDDGIVARVEVATRWGEAVIDAPEPAFELLVAADPKPGVYNGTACAVDDRGAATCAPLRLVRENERPHVDVLDAAHVLGTGFRVNLTARDLDGQVLSLVVATPFGRTEVRDPAEGAISVVVPAIPTRGEHPVVVTARDDLGGVTRVVVHVNVTGVLRVVYDREIVTTLGTYQNVETFAAPPRLQDGSIVICTVQRCDAAFVGTTIAVAHGGGVCSTFVRTACTFSTGQSGGTFTVAWSQITASPARVRIVAYEV